jgi:glycosyltransferase involved in cell wall biosynthesis
MDGEHRILQIISGFSPESPLGGIERYVMELGCLLADKNVPLTIYGLWKFDTPFEIEWINKLKEQGIDVVVGGNWDPDHPYRSFWNSISTLKNHFARMDFKIIHSHGQFCDIAAILLRGIYFKTPLIRTIHHEYEWRKRRSRRLLFTQVLFPLIFEKEIGVSPAVVGELNQRIVAKILNKKAGLVLNGILVEKYQNKANDGLRSSAVLHIPPGKLVIGSVGRLVPEKGYADLLQAVNIVLQKSQDVVTVIVGSGPEEGNLADLIVQMDLDDHVRLIGPLNNLETIYPHFDIFVSSSHREALPTVLLESMASGIPVIATQTTGAREIIRHMENGFLVPINNPRQLAEGLLELIQKPDLRTQLAERASEDVLLYSFDKVADEQLKIYTDLLSKK